MTEGTLMRIIYTLLVLVLAGLVMRHASDPAGDFDFSTGVVRCGVAGLSASCGSVVTTP